ncbi:MAG TPA: TIGR03619 family F420-dependent LLM class oxidoreductase [Actinomycetota bacterium]|nr:TIGR03619 family F420-dependent LLM class oxidoreductase [Actinomycetota bacterium]
MSRPAFSLSVPNYGPLAEPGTLLEIFRAAEQLGYEGVWFADHLIVPSYARQITLPNFYESLALCAFGLGSTSRLRFGIDVLVVPYRDPIVVAKQAATIDRLSGGRLMLGAGVGFLRGEFDALGISYADRAAIAEEHLRVMRLLWNTEGLVSFDGRWSSFRDVLFEPKPTSLPVFVGGNIRRARMRAAELGDGWHPLWPTPDDYAAGRDEIVRRRKELGNVDRFLFSYSCPLTRVLDGPPVEAIPSADRSFTDGSMEEMREGFSLPPDYSYSPPAPIARDGHPMFFGTAEQIREDIEALLTAGVEHFCLRFSFGMGECDAASFLTQMKAFAAMVLPRIEA